MKLIIELDIDDATVALPAEAVEEYAADEGLNSIEADDCAPLADLYIETELNDLSLDGISDALESVLGDTVVVGSLTLVSSEYDTGEIEIEG